MCLLGALIMALQQLKFSLFGKSNDDFRTFRLEKSFLTSASVTGDIANLDKGLFLHSCPAPQDSFSAFFDISFWFILKLSFSLYEAQSFGCF